MRSCIQPRSIFSAVSNWPQFVVQFAGDARLFLFARLEHPCRQFPQLVLPALEFVLVLLAQRNVAQDYGKETPFAFGRLRYRGLDRKFLAVAAQRP